LAGKQIQIDKQHLKGIADNVTSNASNADITEWCHT